MRSVWVSAVRHSRGCALSPPPPCHDAQARYQGTRFTTNRQVSVLLAGTTHPLWAVCKGGGLSLVQRLRVA